MPTLVLSLAAVNALVFFLFWHDKRQAIAGGRRIPESTLLSLSAIGGSPGALLAQRLFRHKTQKQPFATFLMLIAAVHLAILFWLGGRGF